MLHDLKTFLIFLHGLAGSGKGEVQKALTSKFSGLGYDVTYVSSGDLFREAFADPTIAEHVRQGKYLDTLAAIRLGIESSYKVFLQEWVQSHGRAILLLDGLVRRGAFTDQQGQRVPSQVYQVAEAFHRANRELITADQGFLATPLQDYGYDDVPPSALISAVENTIIDGTHILVDVHPQDVERQMIRRADQEVASILNQLNAKIADGLVVGARAQTLLECVRHMERLLHGAVVVTGAGVVYADVAQARDDFPPDLHEPLAHEATALRRQVAQMIGVDASASFASAFRALGIRTAIRDDDIPPMGRKTRIANFVQAHMSDSGVEVYDQGFACRALTESLGYRFSPEGAFTSRTENHLVMVNGARRGVSLEAFRRMCEGVAERIYAHTEDARQALFSS